MKNQMSKQQIEDAKKQADGLLITAKHIKENYDDTKDSKLMYLMYAPSYLTLSYTACEIYFKILISTIGKFYDNTHSLLRLYDLLPKTIKEEIVDIFYFKESQDFLMWNVIKFDTFKENLTSHESRFKEWKNNFNEIDLTSSWMEFEELALALQKLVNNI